MSLDPGSNAFVTASDLVRHFGLWQERAARAPLYILHRGRPRFVLVSVETMETLCASHDAAAGVDVITLLDSVSDLVLVADADRRLLAASRAARAHFGRIAGVGSALEAVVPLAMRPFLADAVRRVSESGVAEPLAFVSPVRGGRKLAATIVPVGRGVALFARDGTSEREQAETRAAVAATARAMAALRTVAVAALSLRGHIIDPGPALMAMTGLGREALTRIRFAALFEIGGRVALGDAVERVLGEGAVETLETKLLVNRAEPLPVRIALAPIRIGGTIDGASVVVAASAPARAMSPRG